MGEDPERDTSEAGPVVSIAAGEKATRSDAEEKTKEILRRTERMEREHEVLATLVLLCLLNVVRGGRMTVSRLATRYPKSKA